MNPDKVNQESHDEIDGMLDAALAKYVAEPRAGLEERILTNLRTAETWAADRLWPSWRIATALAVVLIVAAALAWRWTREAHPPVAKQPSIPAAPNATKGPNPKGSSSRAHEESAKRRVRRRLEHEVVAANPKLDVFPSPQPLSAEEVALAQYAKNFPKEAQLVAQAQEEFDLETRKVMDEAGSATPSSGSIQQER